MAEYRHLFCFGTGCVWKVYFTQQARSDRERGHYLRWRQVQGKVEMAPSTVAEAVTP